MARRAFAAAGLEANQSDDTFRRFLDGWRERHQDQWVFYREGASALNDKCLPYIARDYDRIAVGDVLVADGHRLNFETLNPWTGKAKRMTLILWLDMKSAMPLGWEVMPNENTLAILSAFRRALMRLGKIPSVAYLDNGRAFSGRFFAGADLAPQDGLYERLGVQVTHAWPYHGQSKTVERFFRDFAELERWTPSYTGTSIEAKPPRLNRGERLHRRVYEKAGSPVLDLEQTHAAIAWYFDEYAARIHDDGHLAGQTSAEVFEAGRGPGLDVAALDYLLMSVEVRRIYRDGIHLMGRSYWHTELYGRNHAVTVRYDLQDPERILVYDDRGLFLCEAGTREAVHPAAGILGTERDRELLAERIAERRRLEKSTTRGAREFLETEVLPAHRRQLEGPAIGRDRHIVHRVVKIPDVR
jgi:putative transposase